MKDNEIGIKLQDYVDVKQTIDSLDKPEYKDLLREMILRIFLVPDGYTEYVWTRVIKDCFPQYNHLLKTITTFL